MVEVVLDFAAEPHSAGGEDVEGVGKPGLICEF
jgi:hypothetical protein